MKLILGKIQEGYPNFSPAQRKLAEYLIQNLNEALLLNATQLAHQAQVSEASVTRFISRLGFTGFAEFKREIGQMVIQGDTTADKLVESEKTLDGSGSIFKAILAGDIENIQATAGAITEADFQTAVDRLSAARSIYVLGLRSSHALAFHLAFNLRFFLHSIKLITPGTGDIPEQIVDAGKEDILVAISFKRYTREVIRITEKVKKKGIYVLGITDSPLSPVAQSADLFLTAKANIPTYIDSFTAPMSLLNALITAIALRKKKDALPALNRLEKEFKEFETHTK